jgi:hypothetical protein
MLAFATKLNYDKDRDGRAIRGCGCATVMGVWIGEDSQKLWRCSICFKPGFHPTEQATEEQVDVYPPPYDCIDWSKVA